MHIYRYMLYMFVLYTMDFLDVISAIGGGGTRGDSIEFILGKGLSLHPKSTRGTRDWDLYIKWKRSLYGTSMMELIELVSTITVIWHLLQNKRNLFPGKFLISNLYDLNFLKRPHRIYIETINITKLCLFPLHVYITLTYMSEVLGRSMT